MNGLFWDGIEDNKRQYDPNQIEIKFFWPLTEQVPLDLDYTGCAREITYSPSNLVQGTFLTTAVTGSTVWSPITTSLRVDVQGEVDGYMKIGNLEIAQKKPNFIRKLIYKLLGFNWEKK
jgi:hypothetical protein